MWGVRMIISHKSPLYRERWQRAGANKHNGAYYYSKEIVENIIPRVKTDRHWVTINSEGECRDHSIVFIHNNINIAGYSWMSRYKDLVLVCGVPQTMRKVAHLGKPIHLPLSVDVAYVSQFRREKTKDIAYVGRSHKRKNYGIGDADCIEDLPREDLLARMAEYERVYAVGRCAIEARVLGCEVLAYDARYPDPDVWQVLDNADAAAILQRLIDEVDHAD